MSGAKSRYERARAHKAGREDAIAGRPWENAGMPNARTEWIYLKSYAATTARLKRDFKTIS